MPKRKALALVRSVEKFRRLRAFDRRHPFSAHYEWHLRKYVNTPTTLLQIGLREDGILEMWQRWLGPRARIIGVDRSPGRQRPDAGQIAVRVGDEASPAFLHEIVQEFGRIDVVIDDGSHEMRDVLSAFDFLYEHVAPGGAYLIRGTLTAYKPEYGGGLNEPGTIVARFKDLIDELHARHVHNNALRPTAFTDQTLRMTTYDGTLVFEKKG